MNKIAFNQLPLFRRALKTSGRFAIQAPPKVLRKSFVITAIFSGVVVLTLLLAPSFHWLSDPQFYKLALVKLLETLNIYHHISAPS